MTMNKLVLNPDDRNHIKFMPGKNRAIPETEEEQLKLVEDVYNALVEKGTVLYEKIKKGSHSIVTVKLEDSYFIVVSIKNEFKTYNNIIYETYSENDAIAISKFIGKNINRTMHDYKQQILDAKKMHVVREEEAPTHEDQQTSESGDE